MIKNSILVLLTATTLCSCSNKEVNYNSIIENVYSSHFVGSVDVDEIGEKSSLEDILLHEKHEELTKIILDRVYSGSINVFSALDPSVKLTQKEIELILYTDEYFDIEEDNGEITNKHIKTKLTSSDISHLSFQEDWKYTDQGKIIKEVKKVALHSQSFEEDGTYRGKLILFWVEL